MYYYLFGLQIKVMFGFTAYNNLNLYHISPIRSAASGYYYFLWFSNAGIVRKNIKLMHEITRIEGIIFQIRYCGNIAVS